MLDRSRSGPLRPLPVGTLDPSALAALHRRTAAALVKRRDWPLVAVFVTLAQLLSISFYATPLRPWTDQGLMLDAAGHYARGEGLTVATPTRDLTNVELRPLTYFPPLYPLLVAVLIKAGLAVTA